MLWYNSCIKIKGKWIGHRFLGASRLIRISDIYDSTLNRFLTIQEYLNSYGDISNYLNYLSLIAAIPISWKNLLKQESVIKVSEIQSNLNWIKSTMAQSIYTKLVEKRNSETMVRRQWGQ